MIQKQQVPEILAESLKEMLITIPFKKVTVQNIVENCQMTRTTFYRHFKDKYELMNWIYYSKIQTFLDANPHVSSWKDLLDVVASHMKANQLFFSSIVSFNGQNSFEEFLFQYGSNYCIAHLKNISGRDAPTLEESIAVTIYVDGTIRVLFDWVRSGCKERPEEIARIMSECLPNPLTKYFIA